MPLHYVCEEEILVEVVVFHEEEFVMLRQFQVTFVGSTTEGSEEAVREHLQGVLGKGVTLEQVIFKGYLWPDGSVKDYPPLEGMCIESVGSWDPTPDENGECPVTLYLAVPASAPPLKIPYGDIWHDMFGDHWSALLQHCPPGTYIWWGHAEWCPLKSVQLERVFINPLISVAPGAKQTS
jgi:hypothetical protein